MGENVLVSTNADTRHGSKCYHTDAECHRVEIGTMREVSLSHASGEMGLGECDHCSGSVDRSHTGEQLCTRIRRVGQ